MTKGAVVPLFRAHRRRLVLRSTVARALGLRLVLLFPANIGFVDLNLTGQDRVVFGIRSLDPRDKEPRRLLGYPKFPVDFHAGHAFQTGRSHVDNDRPGLVAQLRGLHDSSLAYGEELAAILASEAHCRVCGTGGPHASAVGANGAVRPALLLEPAFSGSIVGKHLEQLGDSQAFSMGASGGVLWHGAFSLVGVLIAVIKIP